MRSAQIGRAHKHNLWKNLGLLGRVELANPDNRTDACGLGRDIVERFADRRIEEGFNVGNDGRDNG